MSYSPHACIMYLSEFYRFHKYFAFHLSDYLLPHIHYEILSSMDVG